MPKKGTKDVFARSASKWGKLKNDWGLSIVPPEFNDAYCEFCPPTNNNETLYTQEKVKYFTTKQFRVVRASLVGKCFCKDHIRWYLGADEEPRKPLVYTPLDLRGRDTLSG